MKKPDSEVPPDQKKLLIVDDNDLFRTVLKNLLTTEGYHVVEADNGVLACQLFEMFTVDAVISDIDMPHMNGVELLKSLRKTSKTPVILMTGFSDLLETQEAFELGANDFITKPFKKDDLVSILQRLIHPKKPAPAPIEPEASDTDDEYCRVAIDDFISGSTFLADVHIRLSRIKYVKIVNKGDTIPIDIVRKYKDRGVEFLYLRKEDFREYVNFNVMLSQAAAEEFRVPRDRVVALLRYTSDAIQEFTQRENLDTASFLSTKQFLVNTVSVLSESGPILSLLDTLNSHSNHQYAHSLGVSMYSVMIGRKMGWTSGPTLLKLSMGGLFHDIGKKELPVELLEKPREAFTIDDTLKYETHPSRGAELLSRIHHVPSEVVQIVMQHHEYCSGNGYPANLRRNKIHPLARVVCLANEFSDLVIRSPHHPGIPVPEALVRLSASAANFDPVALQALKELFNLHE